jgi:hypothetical protein
VSPGNAEFIDPLTSITNTISTPGLSKEAILPSNLEEKLILINSSSSGPAAIPLLFPGTATDGRTELRVASNGTTNAEDIDGLIISLVLGLLKENPSKVFS